MPKEAHGDGLVEKDGRRRPGVSVLEDIKMIHCLPDDTTPWGSLQGAMKIYPFSIHFSIQYLDCLIGKHDTSGLNLNLSGKLNKEDFVTKAQEWAEYSPFQAILQLYDIKEHLEDIRRHVEITARTGGHFENSARVWRLAIDEAIRYDIADLEVVLADVIGESEDRFIDSASSLLPSRLTVLLDVLQSLIDRNCPSTRLLERIIKGIVKQSGHLPRYLFISNVRRVHIRPVAGGGFADVWQGEVDGRSVALKVLRTFGSASMIKDVHQELCKEAMIWRQFNHPNVLPFAGVFREEDPPELAMVSPWMQNGNILTYLKLEPGVDRGKLILGIAKGLEYLHVLKPGVVHGDLRATNVLVDERGHPRVADFGLAQLVDSQACTVAATSFNGKGSMRWQAPELLGASRFNGESNRPTVKTDVYAFSCVCLEMFTEEIPFAALRDGEVIMDVVVHKKQPLRPQLSTASAGLTDDIWEIMQTCWSYTPAERPHMPDVVKRLTPLIAFDHELRAENRSCRDMILQSLDVLSFADSQETAKLFWQEQLQNRQSASGTNRVSPRGGSLLSSTPLTSENGDLKSADPPSPGSMHISLARVPIRRGTACNICRARKIKCDRQQPSCSSCAQRPLACSYVRSSGRGKQFNVAASLGLVPGLAKRKYVSDSEIKDADKKLRVDESFDAPVAIGDDMFPGDVDLPSLPENRKKEGSGWFAIFNPKVKRVLDMGLIHTLRHESVVCCVRFSADGRYLATGCNRMAQIYDVKTGTKTCVLDDEEASGYGDLYIRSVCFSPDGKYLATGAEDKIIRVWNIAKKIIRYTFVGHEQEIFAVVFSKDGHVIASGSGDGTARCWDMESGSQRVFEAKEPMGADVGMTSVALSPDRSLLAAGSLDTVIRIWDVATGNLIERLNGHHDSVYSVAFTPGGGLVSGGLDKVIKHWDLAGLSSGPLSTTELPAKTKPTSSNPVSSAGGDINRRKQIGAGERGSQCTHTYTGHKDYVLSVASSQDGRWVASASKDRSIMFWDQRTAEAQFMLKCHKNSIISIDVSPAGGMFATGSGDWGVRIWTYNTI